MIQFEDLGIKIFQSALFKTTSTVVETADFILVVDPNWLPDEVKQIQNYVAKIQKSKQVLLLFTHSDYDHIIGYQAFPDAKVIASKALADNPKKEEILNQIRKFDDEYYIERDYEINYPKLDYVISEDFEKMKFPRSKLTFFQAPGHNADGIFTLVQPNNILIAGDYLSDVEFPYIYHSSFEYETTLHKAANIIRKFQPRFLVPGHGMVCTSELEMKKRIEDSLVYIQNLRTAIKNREEYPFQRLMENYKFPGIMKQFHDGNVKLIREELFKMVI